MSTDTTLCLECGKPAAGQLVCPGCGVVPSVRTEETDYFAVFGLARKLTLDPADLERRYYELSRKLHPDLHQGGAAAEQLASLRTTALVNRAYRTLRDPMQRALYWITLHGDALGRNNERVPPALAALVFEVQEKLDELRTARTSGATATLERDLRVVQASLQEQMAATTERLRANFDRTDLQADDAALAETKAILSELHYLRTLMRDVEKELDPEWTAS